MGYDEIRREGLAGHVLHDRDGILTTSATGTAWERKPWVQCLFVLSDYTPMAPTLVREPFHRDGWVYEEKVDGWRMLAYKDGERVRLVSRNGHDHTRRFASIAAAIAKLSARSSTSSCVHASTGCESQTRTRSPRRRCSWRSICSTRMVAS
jgi:hypothetical protein